MPEVDPGFEQLFHGDTGHLIVSLFRLFLRPPSERSGSWPPRVTRRRTTRPRETCGGRV